MRAPQHDATRAAPTLTAQVGLPLTLLAENGAEAHAPLRLGAVSVALLVDGENCAPNLIAAALAEAGKFGVVCVRRVYANPAVLSQRGWKEALSHHRLEVVHHERTAIGKNATDISLVVDAMDLLHSGAIGCFCLLASDSDYTPLVERLRAADRVVVGLGRAQTPPALTRACSVFVTLDRPEAQAAPPAVSEADAQRLRPAAPALRLVASAAPAAHPAKKDGAPPPAPSVNDPGGRAPREGPVSSAATDVSALLVTAWQRAEKRDGWLGLSAFGVQLRAADPAFALSAHARKPLKTLVQAHAELFELRQPSDGYWEVRLIGGGRA